MLEARLNNASLMKRIFEAIKDMVTDVNLDCDQTGISLQAMDSSHVALVSMKLSDCAFETYRCDVSRTLGLNIGALCKVFKVSNPNDSLILRCEDEGDTVQFIFDNDKDEKISHLDLKLMQLDQEALGVPDTEFDVTVTMPAKELTHFARFYTEFGDTMTIQVDKNEIRLICRGDVGGGSSLLKPKESENPEELIEIKCTKPTTLQFALRYLNNFTKASSLASSVKLSLSDHSPLEVRYDITSAADECVGSVRFFLAPKMEADNDEGMN